MYQIRSVPIDGIFTSSTLEIEGGGYFLFGLAQLDHRGL
jgi:hypothetical protein